MTDQTPEHDDQQADQQAEARRRGKAQDAYRTISEVAEDLDLPQHVLRFWETKFTQLKPLKRGGNRRYYRPSDIELLKAIKLLLHTEGYTIRGVQKLFKEQGSRVTVEQALSGQTPLQKAQDPAPEGEKPAPPLESATTPHTSVASTARPSPAPTSLPNKAESELRGVLDQLKKLRARLD
ncbi:MerR family transcriptional regulator [Yunchengibacter salinarum]|uniref:MerR family transcriptional regulator n=1 Tax=Yunchengibacter salinarum TaxID=3133399 RepID=UPI0035B57A0F